MPVSTSATAMYSAVQITSDHRMPRGMSFCGFFASCAAVDTASNPMKAKKITPAPRSTPLHPNSPNLPVFGGMNGCQLAVLTYLMPNATKSTSTTTFTMTIVVLKPADSLMPTTRMAETASTISAAGTLNTPVTVLPSARATSDPGGPVSAAGMLTPISCIRLTNVPAQPTAIVEAPSA